MLQICCKLQHNFDFFAIAQLLRAEQEALPAYPLLASSDIQTCLRLLQEALASQCERDSYILSVVYAAAQEKKALYLLG